VSRTIDPTNDSDFLLDMRARIERIASTLPLASQPWDLVDFPGHWNCGDSAIWLGQVRLAGDLGQDIRRVHDRRSFTPAALNRDTVIAYNGGGNWGGLYPSHHRLRLRVLEATRGRDFVQLPQSIEYVDDDHREALRRAVDDHGKVTLLVRDARSLSIAQRDYDCAVHLIPDVAFTLGRLDRSPATAPCVVQRRTDKEATDAGVATESFDWLNPPQKSASRRWHRLTERASGLQRRRPGRLTTALFSTTTSRLASANLQRAQELLSKGEVVMTDRLHGHVLCTLMRIPHVVVNDRFGKISALYNTWTHRDPISRLSPSWDGAIQLVPAVSRAAS
jgi:exopolysaccharide biosynthesis predicted pyruvyltransferase EpsI